MSDLNIPEQRAVAERATEVLKNRFRKNGWKNPPHISLGVVNVVLEVAADVRTARAQPTTPAETEAT